MTTFEKTYIGKGKKNANLDIVRMSFKMSEIIKHTHSYNDEDYITFEIAALKNPDQFGNTHTAYVSKMVTVEDPKPETKPSKNGKKKASKKAETVEDPNEDFPF